MPGQVSRWPGWSWRLSRADLPVDMAVAFLAVAVNILIATSPDQDTSDDVVLERLAILSIVGGATLLLRRRRPLAVFVIETSLYFGVLAVDAGEEMAPFAVIAAYSLGAYAPRRRTGLGLMFVGAAVVPVVATRDPAVGERLLLTLELAVLLPMMALLGVAVSRRRQRAEVARNWSLALARSGARRVARALQVERMELARELHDVVMNGLTAITVHASATRRVPGHAESVLGAIEETSRAATADLRRMLGALRVAADDDPGANEEETTPRVSPLPITGQIEDPSAQPDPQLIHLGRPQWPIDVALGLSVVAINVAGSVVPDTSTSIDYAQPVMPLFVVISSIPGLALIFRRTHPLAAFAAVLVTLGVVALLNWQEGNLPGSLLIAAYALGAWAPLRTGAAALAGMCVFMVLLAGASSTFSQDGSVLDLLLFFLPWAIGVVIRRRRLVEETIMQAALADERALAIATERALAGQRLMVARELNDIVTHGIAAVTVQAGAARHHLPSGPEREALQLIEDTGRAALTDLRRMFELLHDNDDQADLAPTPGMREIHALVERHRGTHGPVRLAVEADVESEPARVRLTTVRLVQEALTNVARHAPGAAATVTIRSGPTSLLVEVEDEGSPSARPVRSRAGWGLAGMRERVAIVGGSFTSHRTAQGGFLVRAELTRNAVG